MWCSKSINIEDHEAYTNLTKTSVELENAISSQMKWESVEEHLNEEQRKMYRASVENVSQWIQKISPRDIYTILVGKEGR